MLTEHFTAVLWVTGAITTLPVLQFFAPRRVLALMYRIEMIDKAGLFFARHRACSPPPWAGSSC